MNNQENIQNTSTSKYQGSIVSLLNNKNFRTYNIVIARTLESVNAAIMLSELCQRFEYHSENDELIQNEKYEGSWFYYTSEIGEERTGLSEKEQRLAISILEDNGIIKKIILGVPGKRHFQINEEKIAEIISFSKNNSRSAKKPTWICQKANVQPPKSQRNIGEENQEETLVREPPPPSGFFGGGGSEKIDISSISYQTAKGDKKTVTETEIYSHFVKSGVEPEILNQAIKELRNETSPINSVMKWLEAICTRLTIRPERTKFEKPKKEVLQSRKMTDEELEERKIKSAVQETKNKEMMKKMGIIK